jgi:hypothetical protein
MRKTNFFFGTLPFNPKAVLATWLYIGAPQKTKKTNLQSILNKNSPQAHMELEFDGLGVSRKLMKYVVHFSK